MASIEVDELSVRFGAVTAVDAVSLRVPAGTGVALIGSNGAGKSTTMRVLAGLVPASSGSVTVMGQSMTHTSPSERSTLRRLVGYCPDVGGLIPRATPWEHLELAATLFGLGSGWQPWANELLTRMDLNEAADRVTAGFSHGMSRRMSVVLAVFPRSPVLLLDEPFDGVDPLGVDATLDLISERRAEGVAVLVSTHLLDLAISACSQAIVLSNGRTVAATESEALAGDAGRATYKALLG